MNTVEDEQPEFVNFPETQFSTERAVDFMVQTHDADWGHMMQHSFNKPVGKEVFAPVAFAVGVRAPAKPMRLPKTICYVNRPEFDLLRSEMHSILARQVDFDFSYDDEASLWRGLAIRGSRLLEVEVACYWDKKLQDHLVCVRKVDGDMLELSANDVFADIQRELCVDIRPSERQSSVCGARPACPGKVGMMSSPRRCSTESVVGGLRTMLDMAQSELLGVPCEAAKMLCDFAISRTQSIEEEEVWEVVEQLTTRLLSRQQSEEVQRFGMVALSTLVATQKSFSLRVLHNAVLLQSLVQWATEQSAQEKYAYLNASTRRLAMEVLARLSHVQPSVVRLLVVSVGGFASQEAWMQHVYSLPEQMQSLGREVSHCFDF